jgi:hypothetical protein
VRDRQQLRLDFEAPRDPLADLDFLGHEGRLAALDGIDFEAAPAPRCICVGGPLVVDDELDPHCLTCGRAVPASLGRQAP